MNTRSSNNTIDLHQVTAERRQIAVVWSIEDVKQVRSDINDEQAWHVLQECKRWHDANEGINWCTIETMASQLYP